MRLPHLLPIAVTLFAARHADAFCGFYVSESGQKLENEATQVVLMRVGPRTVLSMQNAYKGPVEAFAMVVPVPVILQKENVKTLPRDLFDKVDALDAPRLVEYWEQDPCTPPVPEDAIGLGNIGTLGHGAGTGSGYGKGEVEVHARVSVGEYDVVILGASDSGALEAWLHDHHYAVPNGAAEVLRPYVQAGSKFFVAKVDPAKVTFEGGRAMLSPLRFHYDTDTFSLPVRLGLLNSAGTQDLVVHILGAGTRYEVANYENVTIPTNLDVADTTKGQFSAFYASLFDRVSSQHPRAVVTEYAWQASTCDPCPGPSLNREDVQTLGGDVAPQGFGAQTLTFEATTSGGLPGEIVQRLLCQRQWAYRGCFPADVTSGSVTASFTIDSDGKVTGVPTFAGTVAAENVKACLTKALGQGSFPKPDPPGKAQATATIHLGHDTSLTPSAMVLTRMHLRYSKEMLRDDLVFKVASPIVGGREFVTSGGVLEEGARPDTTNNFQARYAIRHPWTGKIECQNPRRGVWGGPPTGPWSKTQTATKTAFAPRGGVQLASFLTDRAAASVGLAQPAMTTAPSASASPSAAPSASRSGGCSGCALGETGDGASLAAIAGLAAIVVRARRKRRHDA